MEVSLNESYLSLIKKISKTHEILSMSSKELVTNSPLNLNLNGE